ncbi:MAG: hypothetical protein P4L74_03960 [Candidatus Doudnabacteria bacterium]|nr:hypothetical protein [Candidatus Doudnabacteria bacterium]
MNGKNNNWGLGAIYEGQKLVFSGTFNLARVRRERWQKFWTGLLRQAPASSAVDKDGMADVYQLFSANAKTVWSRAFFRARKRKSAVRLEDVFSALLDEPSVGQLFLRLGENAKTAKLLLKNYLKLEALGHENDVLKKIPFEAYVLAVKLHDHRVGSLMLLGALLKLAPKDSILQSIFTNIGLNAAKLELFAVWLLNLNFTFPPNSTSDKFLFCLKQVNGLEEHFGYFFELSAIETAVEFSQDQTSPDLQHAAALRLLVKAGLLARNKDTKIIFSELVSHAFV